jgi:hypothetical protein
MTDFDPTTNRIPFSLLSEDEQTALIHWPHGWEYYSRWSHSWNLCSSLEWAPEWATEAVYRGLPVVTSNWFNVYPYIVLDTPYPSREKADDAASKRRIAVMRIDLCNGVSTAHLEGV